jgi:hypothetical protein
MGVQISKAISFLSPPIPAVELILDKPRIAGIF